MGTKTGDRKIPKAKTVKQLIKALDAQFSTWIRMSNADENGIVKCCTCGKMMEWKKSQCGHFLSRRYMSVRFDEKNCAPQCVGCNIFNQGSQAAFRRFLVQKYGEPEVNKIELKKFNKSKLDAFSLGLLIQEYSNKVTQLKNGK